MKQTCHECKQQFLLTSQQFYCCDPSQIVCSFCRRKPCHKCKKPRSFVIDIPKCQRCESRLYQNDLLLESKCGSYFCSKCLSHLFKDAYFKVTIEKEYQGQDLELDVQLYCKDQFPYDELVKFFQHFCLSCGRAYDSTLDYELTDGVKLCFMCYYQVKEFFQDLLIRCEFCQVVIKNSSYASILDNSQTAVCQKCTKQSQISENLISQSRKKPFNNFFSNQAEQKTTVIEKEKKDFFKPPVQPPIKEVQQKNVPKIQVPQIHQKQEAKSRQIAKSPLTRLLKKPSISELKQKHEKRVSNTNQSNSISVTSKFSNNFEEMDEEVMKSLGLPQDFKLKKHLSNETYVENFLIEVTQNNPKGSVKCRRCCTLTDEKMAYDLYDFEDQMSKSKLTTISFKPNGTISSISKKDSAYFICRVCYFKSSEREKSVLNASISTRPKSNFSNRPSKLQETMDLLKPGKSVRKEMRSPSPSPNKQYSLTGSKDSIIEKQTNSSLLSPGISKMEQQSSYQRYPMSRQTTSQSIPPKSMRCERCRNLKKSLIATRRGYECDDCYYGRGLYADPFLR